MSVEAIESETIFLNPVEEFSKVGEEREDAVAT